jgi:demethylmenaquinone methyltransferase / 2-methoxy-6-polyprenyl-1,4-benzoquinol methylase
LQKYSKVSELSTALMTNTMDKQKSYTGSSSNKAEMEKMFDSISGKYDFLNHFLSLNIDKNWRRKAVDELESIQPKKILDMATGTADLAMEANRLGPDMIVGIDLSENMLAVGREKLKKKGWSHISLEKGDSENIHYDEHSFDACTVGFGVRNFENLDLGISEIYRVLKPGGKLVVLEFSKPDKFPVKQLYKIYSDGLMPLWGKLFSGSKSAYTYLPESVKKFPDGQKFLNFMTNCGFVDTKQRRLSFGICSIYSGTKQG